MKRRLWFILIILLIMPGQAWAETSEARDLIVRAWDYMRGKTSVSEMTVHREDWERRSVIKAWTKGLENSIFQIMTPKKDKGNGTLKKGREMWTYNPKINRVIKISPSMMRT